MHIKGFVGQIMNVAYYRVYGQIMFQTDRNVCCKLRVLEDKFCSKLKWFILQVMLAYVCYKL